jgi:prepilin peptidase CpaA
MLRSVSSLHFHWNSPMAHDVSIAGSAGFQAVLLALGVMVLLAAAVHDVAARTIPNWAPAAIAGLGIALRSAQGQLLGGLALGLAVFLVAAICWTRGWIGGGDVKLLGATAIFIAPVQVGGLLVSITLAGGVVGLIYLACKQLLARLPGAADIRPRPRGLVRRVLRVERWRLRRGGSLPYASAIAFGALFVIVSG